MKQKKKKKKKKKIKDKLDDDSIDDNYKKSFEKILENFEKLPSPTIFDTFESINLPIIEIVKFEKKIIKKIIPNLIMVLLK